jgi:uncharacterized protein YbaR (Trm112 family)
MIDAQLLELIRCPATGASLRIADAHQIEEVNRGIEAGEVRDASDQIVAEPLDGGLITEGGDRLYPIRGKIPVLIAEEAIALPLRDSKP